ncbi:MAG: beta-lactamase family protein, partial [Thioalkalivibrio sp.]|nr:beta-lactamase family protein [Thioalkalivibrio sp.]
MIDRRLERFVQQQMIATRIPGLSLVLLRGDETAERHFGFKDLRSRVPPRSATRYGIGSVTKVFTAVAVLQLVQEGRVGLDDPVARHLGADAKAFGAATIRHLLAHASGLPALGWSETKMSSSWFMDGFPVGGFDDLATFMHGAEAWRTAEPGSRWQYSNEGYIVLGRLLEQIDGMQYVDSLARRVLAPLGMTRSTFDPDTVASDDDRVQPYMLDDDGRLVHGANLHGVVPAAGGLVTTSADMASFARCLLANGRTPDGQQLLDPTSLETM